MGFMMRLQGLVVQRESDLQHNCSVLEKLSALTYCFTLFLPRLWLLFLLSLVSVCLSLLLMLTEYLL